MVVMSVVVLVLMLVVSFWGYLSNNNDNVHVACDGVVHTEQSNYPTLSSNSNISLNSEGVTLLLLFLNPTLQISMMVFPLLMVMLTLVTNNL